MRKKVLAGLGIVAVLIILLLVFYRFYPKGAPEIRPRPAETPTAESRPGIASPERAGPTGPLVPPEPPAAKLPQPAGPGEAPRPPEVRPPAPREAVLPPLEPQKQYGLLFKSYRRYRDAEKMLTKLKKQGDPAFIRRNDRRKVYEVWAGPFPTRDQARKEAKRLKSKLKMAPKLQKLEIPVPK